MNLDEAIRLVEKNIKTTDHRFPDKPALAVQNK